MHIDYLWFMVGFGILIFLMFLIVVTLLYVGGAIDRGNNSVEDKKSENKDKKEIFMNIEIYKERVIQEEELMNSHIDSWDEVKLTHPLFNDTFLYTIAPILGEIEFISDIYIASNGLLRLNIEGKGSNIFNDIALHPKEGEILLIRSEKTGYKDMEDLVIKTIIRYVEEVKRNMKTNN